MPVQNFQLFRNGKEVPIYTTAASGTLGPSDYIEFWGQMNDGVPDAPLYRNPAYQHTQHKSLETDTAVYFLTVNATGSTFHYVNTPNNPAGSPLPIGDLFHVYGRRVFHSQLNPGFAQVVGEALYSSAYDMGEFWSSRPIYPGAPVDRQQFIQSFCLYGRAECQSVKFGMAGDHARFPDGCRFREWDGSRGYGMNSYSDWLTTETVPMSLISSNNASR